jgi:hypothetical protein
VKAYYLPRTWQRLDPQATGAGSAGGQTNGGSVDGAIPEVIGDFDGNGNLTKEDLRYFADGLAMSVGQLNRKQGAIDIDNALATYGRCDGNNQVICRIGVPTDCTDHGTTSPCNIAGTYPWADPANQIEIPVGLGLDPKFALPKDVDDVGSPFLATGKSYAAGDFRGDVAGRSPVAGAQPVGWDGFVDDQDIDYCCRMALLGSWHELNDAVYIDLSCDMNGDLEVNDADVTELVEVILGTLVGDVNLDGAVDPADTDIIVASIFDPNPCNSNGSCGWADGDANCDGYVDSADLGGTAPAAVQPDGTGVDNSRFISFNVPPAATAADAESALRVTLTSLHHVLPLYTDAPSIPFTLFEGKVMWVGPPVTYIESESSLTPFKASHLQCDPHYRNWSTVGLLAVTGEAIVPSSIYNVENLAFACQNLETTPPCLSGGVNVSSTLTIKTGRWGDAVATFQDPDLVASQPDFDDIGALVNKFKSLLGAPIKSRAKLAGVDARGLMDIVPDVGFDDIPLCVDGFKGRAYPYKPGKCTGDVTKACISDADCTNAPNPTTGPCILCP